MIFRWLFGEDDHVPAADMTQEGLDQDAVVVTVSADASGKYRGTDVFRDEPVREGYRSPGLQLLESAGWAESADILVAIQTSGWPANVCAKSAKSAKSPLVRRLVASSMNGFNREYYGREPVRRGIALLTSR